MQYLIYGLITLGVIAFILGILRNRALKRKLERGEINEMPQIKQIEDMECCGQHEVCEKESLLAAISKDIEYYNDEELDRFRGKESEDYTSDEIEEFREVLFTMRDDEVAGWVRSLQLRSINLPDDIKNDVYLIVGELRK
ncbi:MAG: phospholipase [Bacteroidaceae bacterium]|nr:phospholipase [Bacteroidaceae bacterium]MBR4590931.1 phospholipase [Bacteroidaceae bacterium]MCR4769799.1 phospholipase [Bacteroidaceae bacterium]